MVRILGSQNRMQMPSRVNISFDDFLGHLRDPRSMRITWLCFGTQNIELNRDLSVNCEDFNNFAYKL